MQVLFFAALLGIVQGLTEFLPVSSTAHLLVGERILGFRDPGSVFTELIQVGSILAMVWVFRDRIIRTILGLRRDAASQRFAVRIMAGVLPALLLGWLFSDLVEAVLHRSAGVIALSFVAGGLVMLRVEQQAARRARRGTVGTLSWPAALGIGVAQALALVPGVSRSGATIVAGLAVGLDRAEAAEFSFFLAIPTMAAASAHSLLALRGQIDAVALPALAVGFIAAFVSSVLVVQPFLAYVRRDGFRAFAYYRIAAGLGLGAAVLAGWGL